MTDKLNTFFFFGRPFSPLYSTIMKVRASLYAKKIIPRKKMAVPVISVGNLTMGGTGKTPTVHYLAKFLQKNGYRPAIISRGYGGSTREKYNVVSDGKKILMEASKAGDEPVMLARALPGVVVVTGVVRSLPCQYAIDHLDCNILILDDGFQHLRVERDLDLVLFNSSTLAGNSRVFPGGDLREPISALFRADAFILTGTNKDNKERAERFSLLLNEKYPGIPVFFNSLKVAGAVDSLGETINIEAIPQPCYCFSGIAQPQLFKKTIADNAVNSAGFTSFNDHQRYTAKIIKQLENKAKETEAVSFLTTEKDTIKIKKDSLSLPLYTLATSPEFHQDFSIFIADKLGIQ